ncbi:hypothetical protein [Xenophilus sp.]|uniref:hypothetical protein n=1 Tax=Xenophilus sp. TaxID=1873499 RepID=UPI0037DDBA00
MKIFSLTALLIATALAGTAVQAQDRVWRCGNEYTNNTAEAQRRGCKLVEGGNVTIVQGTRPAASASSSGGGSRAGGSSPAGSPKVDSTEQRQRDSDARAVLESELRKAQSRQAELLKEYNNGEPERQGNEKNYQKYLDRVAEMKAQIERNESDIAGLQRELSRLPAGR